MIVHSFVMGTLDLFVKVIRFESLVNAIVLFSALKRVSSKLFWNDSWNSTSKCPHIVLSDTLISKRFTGRDRLMLPV